MRPTIVVAATIAAILVIGDAVRELVFRSETRTVVSVIPPPATPKKRVVINIANRSLCTYKWSLSDDFDISDDPFVLIPDLLERLERYQKQLVALKAITPDESAALRLSAEDAACEYKRIDETVNDIVTLINIAQQQMKRDEAKARERKPDEEKPKGNNPRRNDEEKEEKDSIPGVRDDEVVPT